MISNSTNSPFPGLRPFEFEDSEFFFGRDEQIDELYYKLLAKRFVAVVGGSGSGKSSLVKAGLRNKLANDASKKTGTRWHIIKLRPMGSPLKQLATAVVTEKSKHREESQREVGASLAISRAESRLTLAENGLVRLLDEIPTGKSDHILVIVDQFEELFRYPFLDRKVGFDERALFVKLLLHASTVTGRKYHVLITMRSEFLGECPSFQGLAEAINDSQFLTPRLTREQRKQAIVGPIELVNAFIKPELLQRLLNDVGNEPDQLPVLQHSLMRCWQNTSHEGELDLECYQSVGLMKFAISNHADNIFDSLNSRKKIIAESIFKQLTEIDSDGRAIRRPQTFKQLQEIANCSEKNLLAVLNAFRSREVSFVTPGANVTIGDETIIDISHEALIRKWKKLRLWLEEEASNGKVYSRLFDLWKERRENKKNYLGSFEAHERHEWWKRVKPTALWSARYSAGQDSDSFLLVKSFLYESLAHAEKQARNVKWLRGLVFVILTVAVGVLLLFNNSLKNAITDAETQRILATQSLSQVYKSRMEYGEGILEDGDRLTPVLLALESLPDKDSKKMLVKAKPLLQEPVRLLQKALSQLTPELILDGHEGSVISATYSSDGTRVLTVSDEDGTVRVWSAITGEIIHIIRAQESKLFVNNLFTGTDRTLQPLQAQFSPNTNEIIVISSEGVISRWDTKYGELIYRGNDSARKFSDKYIWATFSPNSKHIITTSKPLIAELWDIGQKASIWTLPIDKLHQQDTTEEDVDSLFDGDEYDVDEYDVDEYLQAVFSPDSKLLLTLHNSQSVKLWDISKETLSKDLFAGDDLNFKKVGFSPNSKFIYGVSDFSVSVWDAASGKLEDTVSLDLEQVLDASFAPRNDQVYANNSDASLAERNYLPELWIVGEYGISSWKPSDEKGDRLTELSRQYISSGYSESEVYFSRSSPTIGIIDNDYSGVKIINLEQGGSDGTYSQNVFDEKINSISFSNNGRDMLVVLSDGTARIWTYKKPSTLATKSDLIEPSQSLADLSNNAVQDLVSEAKSKISSCLTLKQREKLQLGESSPEYCEKLWPNSSSTTYLRKSRYFLARGLYDVALKHVDTKSPSMLGSRERRLVFYSLIDAADSYSWANENSELFFRILDLAGQLADPLNKYSEKISQLCVDKIDFSDLTIKKNNDSSVLYLGCVTRFDQEFIVKYKDRLTEAYFDLGLNHRGNREHKSALTAFQMAAEHSAEPKFDISLALAKEHESLSDYNMALDEINRAILINTKDIRAQMLKARILIKQSKFDSAVTLLKKSYVKAFDESNLLDESNLIEILKLMATVNRIQLNFEQSNAIEDEFLQLYGTEKNDIIYSVNDTLVDLVREDSKFATQALIVIFSNLEQPSNTSTVESFRNSIVISIAEIFHTQTFENIRIEAVTKCDELTASWYDPFRRIQRVPNFSEINLEEAKVACDNSILKYGSQPNLLFQQARVIKQLSRELPLNSQPNQVMNHQSLVKSNLDIAIESQYPAAFNAMAQLYEDGFGVDQSDQIVEQYLVQLLTNYIRCCGAHVAQYLLNNKNNFSKDATLKVANILIVWAANYGNPDAHMLLADSLRDSNPESKILVKLEKELGHLFLAKRFYIASSNGRLAQPEWADEQYYKNILSALENRINSVKNGVDGEILASAKQYSDEFVVEDFGIYPELTVDGTYPKQTKD